MSEHDKLLKEQQRSKFARQNFFDKIVEKQEWKDSMSGKNEDEAIKLLETLNLKLGRDYVRQHPIGERFVLDFAFLKEKVALEIDGVSHRYKKQKKLDKARDSYLRSIGWVAIRLDDKIFEDNYQSSFWKSMIKEVLKDRRKDYQVGELYEFDYKNFNELDYEL